MMYINMTNLCEEFGYRLSYVINNDIQGCELAITDKAKCIGCKEVIAQGTPRLWVWGELKQAPPDEGIVKIKRFICHSCSKVLLRIREKDYLETTKKGKIAEQKLINQNIIQE